MDKPTVPEAAEALRAYYKLPKRGMGGCVHIIVEDANVAQRHADWCVENAVAWGEEWGEGARPDDLEIARMLAAMSPTQRKKLSQQSFYPEED